MSDERLPVERRDHGLVFDPGRASPLVRRGLARLAVQAAALTNTGGAWSLLWSRDLKKRSSVAFPIPEILIEAGTIYAAIPEGLAAIDARSGAERWRVNIVHGSFDALPGEFGERGWAVMGGLLFYPDRDRGLCAVDCTTGAHRWCTGRQWKERPMAVATDQSIVYTSVDDPANDPDAYVCALDASTGNAVWCQKVRIELPDEDTTVQENVVRVVGQLALVRDVNRRIHAVDATSRTVRWYTAGSYALPRLIDGDLAFALGGTWPDEEPSYLAALDLATGQERWRFEAPKGQLSLAHDDIVDGTVHVISWRFGAKKERPFLHALDAHTGTLRWVQELPFGIESSGAPNWVMGKHIDGYHEQVSTTRSAEPIYIRGDTGIRSGYTDLATLIAIDPANGEVRWEIGPLQGGRRPPPRPGIGEAAAYAANTGRLFSFNPQTGRVRWIFNRLAGGFRGGIDVVYEAEDVVVVVCGDGGLYALDTETGAVRDQFAFSPSPSIAELLRPMLQHVLRVGEDSMVSHLNALHEAERLYHHAGTEHMVAVMDSVRLRLELYFKQDLLDIKVGGLKYGGDPLAFDEWMWAEIWRLLDRPPESTPRSLDPLEIDRVCDSLEAPELRVIQAAEIAELLKSIWPDLPAFVEDFVSDEMPLHSMWNVLEPAAAVVGAAVQVSDGVLYLATRDTLYALEWDGLVD